MRTATSGVSNKNGGTPEGARQGKQSMLNVAESPQKASLFAKVGNQFVTQSPDKKAAVWLDEQVEKAQSKVTTQVIDLTPALARVLLGRNDGNRKVSDSTVIGYARDIRNGAWLFNGEPVIVSADGRLNDGQHRCEAIVLADEPIKAVLVIGVERSTRTTLDQGKMRSIGDYLSMSGHSNALQLGDAASLSWQYVNYGRLATGSKERPTKSEIIAFIGEHTEIVNSLEVVQRKGADAAGGRPMLAFIHWKLWQHSNRRQADDFIISLIDGVNLPDGHPILYVRNRLINERGWLRANDKAELIFRAWNSYRIGNPAKNFQVLGGKLPTLEA